VAGAFAIHRDSAPSESYNREESGFEAISQRLITRDQTEATALYVTSFSPPADYTNTFEEDVLLYMTAGRCSVFVDGTEFEMETGSAFFLPGGSEIRHVVREDHEMVVVWSPAPELKKHR
jgi:quercetin dioxygenase-like cupin family protein